MKRNVKIEDAKIIKNLKRYNIQESEFISSCTRFINALKQNRLIAVEQGNGARKKIYFFELAKNKYADKGSFCRLNFNTMILAFGYSITTTSYGTWLITSGGGCDMTYHTTKKLVEKINDLGMLSKKEYDLIYNHKTAERVC